LAFRIWPVWTAPLLLIACNGNAAGDRQVVDTVDTNDGGGAGIADPASGIPTPVTADQNATAAAEDGANMKFDGAGKAAMEKQVKSGDWQVVGLWVSPDGVAAYAKNDPAVIGSKLRYSDAEVKWTKAASTQFTIDDVCKEPVAGIIEDKAENDKLWAEFSGAAAQFGIKSGSASYAHDLLCSGGGKWGPGENAPGLGTKIFHAGESQLMMQWYDGVILHLKHVAE
jgi:hypothetical protein